jgi:hypothetical protein
MAAVTWNLTANLSKEREKRIRKRAVRKNTMDVWFYQLFPSSGDSFQD